MVRCVRSCRCILTRKALYRGGVCMLVRIIYLQVQQPRTVLQYCRQQALVIFALVPSVQLQPLQP
jgi:hypothetical protein